MSDAATPSAPPKPNAVWKYFGAIFMDTKNGHQALSFHKVLGLILFFTCIGVWLAGGTHLSPEVELDLIKEGIELPSRFGKPPVSMMTTLYALLGLKAVGKITDQFGKSYGNGNSK